MPTSCELLLPTWKTWPRTLTPISSCRLMKIWLLSMAIWLFWIWQGREQNCWNHQKFRKLFRKRKKLCKVLSSDPILSKAVLSFSPQLRAWPLVTLFFILQAPIHAYIWADIRSDGPSLWCPGFQAKNWLRHGNTKLSGCDLCTRTMFIICKHEENP